MGFVKYQKSKVQQHQHLFVLRGGVMTCSCGATQGGSAK